MRTQAQGPAHEELGELQRGKRATTRELDWHHLSTPCSTHAFLSLFSFPFSLSVQQGDSPTSECSNI